MNPSTAKFLVAEGSFKRSPLSSRLAITWQPRRDLWNIIMEFYKFGYWKNYMTSIKIMELTSPLDQKQDLTCHIPHQ